MALIEWLKDHFEGTAIHGSALPEGAIKPGEWLTV